ncbi:retinitis pigmentosa 1-like 1 protein [Emydura macquarii macquarii]|uniref:retinitis pigmentosa 1-like 1 protein n=1 Tax=Emydura macquarii macquarii TaxID=1129001 RepID=UPI00352AD346
MGCKLSKKKGFCFSYKKSKDQKAEGAAEISETLHTAQTSQEASEWSETQPPTRTRKDTEEATVETQPMRYNKLPAAPSPQEMLEDKEEALSVLQIVRDCEALATVQSTEKASQEIDAQLAAKMEQEVREPEPNTKIIQDRQLVAQTLKDNGESKHAAEIPVEGAEETKILLDAEIKQDPETQPQKQDWQSASCIMEEYIEDRPVFKAMQEAGKAETSVQTTAVIAEGQPTAKSMQETHQYTDETQPTLQIPQNEIQPMSETPEDQPAAQGALITAEARPTTQSMQEVPQHPGEALLAPQRLQGAEIQPSAQATQDTGETQPALESEVLRAMESEQEVGEAWSAGERTEETEAWPDADRAQESRAHSAAQDRAPAAQSLPGPAASLPAASTTKATEEAEPTLQTARERQARTTAYATRESWTAQGTVEAQSAAEAKGETGAQLVAQGPPETQSTAQAIGAPQDTATNTQTVEDISMGLAEPKTSQESPLGSVIQPTAQVRQEMETLHPVQIRELKENQSWQNDTDSQSPCGLAGDKGRWEHSTIQWEEDQAPEVAKPEQQLNVAQLAPPQELPISDTPANPVPESPVEESQLLHASVPKACESRGEEEAGNAENPTAPET